MKFHLQPIKNFLGLISHFIKFRLFAVFVILIILNFAIAGWIFYQKAYLSTNAVSGSTLKPPQIDQEKLAPIQKIIRDRQTNLKYLDNQNIPDPFAPLESPAH